MSKRGALILLLVVITVGVVLRSWEITSRSIWFDEAFSWRLIEFSWSDFGQRVTHENNPPLYFAALKTWSIVFGGSVLSLRSYSVTMAGLSILAMYGFIVAGTNSRASGVLAAWLTAISAWQIPFAWEIRMYSQGVALTLFASWALLRAIQGRQWRWWTLYALLTALFLYTHYLALYTLIAHAVFIAGYVIRSTRGRVGEVFLGRVFWQSVAAATGVAVLFLPWFPFFRQQLQQVQEGFWVPPIGGWSIPDTFYRMWLPTSTIPSHTGWGWITSSLPIVATVTLWLIILWWRKKHGTIRWLIVTSAAVPFIVNIIVSTIGQSLYQDRYFVFAHIYIVAGAALWLTLIETKWLRVMVVLALTVFQVWGTMAFWQELNIKNQPGMHAAVRWLADSYQAGLITASSSYVFLPADHYIQEEFEELPDPMLLSQEVAVEHFAGAQVLTDHDMADPDVFTKTSEPILWVIDTTGFGKSVITVPSPWRQTEQRAFPEVFDYQGEVVVTKYEK